jgi:hypothetical protein
VATSELAKAVEDRLGRAVFVSASAAELSVEGHVEPGPRKKGFTAVLTLRDARGALLGTRELTRPDASCDALTGPLVLVIALMIDPDAVLTPKSPPPPSPPAAREPVVIEKPVYVEVPAPPPPSAPTWKIDVGAAAISAVGLLPAPNVGVAASGLLHPPKLFPLEGFGAAWFDQNVRNGGASASLALGYVGGGLCPLHYERDRLRVYGCAIGEVGVLTAAPSEGGASVHAYLAGGLEPRLSVRIVGPVAARIGVDAVLPLFRPTITAEGTNLFRASFVGGAADVGLGVLLP